MQVSAIPVDVAASCRAAGLADALSRDRQKLTRSSRRRDRPTSASAARGRCRFAPGRSPSPGSFARRSAGRQTSAGSGRARLPAGFGGFCAGTALATSRDARHDRQFLTTLATAEARRDLRSSALLALLLSLAAALPPAAQVRIKDITDVRGRARQPARRLRPGGRAEQHRRQARQRRVHPRIADRHAGAAGRQHARPGGEAGDQERRRGDGHGRPAGLRPQRQPDRYRGFGAGRRHQPDRRHACW